LADEQFLAPLERRDAKLRTQFPCREEIAVMPWLWILAFIAGVYLVVMLIQGIRDLVSWWVEGRAFAKEQKRAKERRRQAHQANPPPLKERPAPPTKPPKTGP
jgi:hypothetical protein